MSRFSSSHPAHPLVAAVTRMFVSDRARDRVHFHAGEHGRPYVCDDPRCDSPALDVRH